MNKDITVSSVEQTTRQVIVGNAWLNSETDRPTIRLSRNLPGNIVLAPGATMLLNVNKRMREGYQDPNYTVSIILPIDAANDLIQAIKDNQESRQESIPV